MTIEQLKNEALPQALSEVLSDVADLVQKEIRLARAELSAKIATKLQAGVWMAVAAVLGLVAVLLAVEAVVHGIASLGLSLHWAYLVVAIAVAFVAMLVFLKGRSEAAETLAPERSIRNLKTDISAAKEHLA